MNYDDNHIDNDYCSSGYDRIIVRPNGNIVRCYSRNEPMATIYNFDYKKHLKIRRCSQFNCGVCDKTNSIINNYNFISNNKRQLNIQLVVTEQCKHFCPYCIHSDRAKKLKLPIAEKPISDFKNFLNKIEEHCSVVLIGGEPTLRKDLYEIFDTKINHHFIMFSSWVYKKNINKILKTLENSENKLSLIPTLHCEAIGFNWDNFWENVKIAQECKNCYIPRLHLLNYNIDEIVNKVKKECLKLNIKLHIKEVDYSVASNRIIFNNKKFKKL